MPKYLFTFEKNESVRWLGHLDILRAFERAIRRAGLPIAFTQGYNPRIRINFAAPLSTGVTGAAEPAVIELTDVIDPATLEMRLNEVLPPGIRVQRFQMIPEAGMRDMLNAYDRAEYTIVCATSADCSEADAVAATQEMLDMTSIPIERERDGKTRTADIRPWIGELGFIARDSGNGRLSWRAVVSIGERGNVKPAELAQALAVRLPGLALRRAHRVRLISREDLREMEAHVA